METKTSLPVVAEKAVQGLKEGQVSVLKNLSLEHMEVTYKAIIDAALQGDKFAAKLLSEAGYHIGRGIAILTHLLNQELIILSGRRPAGCGWRSFNKPSTSIASPRFRRTQPFKFLRRATGRN